MPVKRRSNERYIIYIALFLLDVKLSIPLTDGFNPHFNFDESIKEYKKKLARLSQKTHFFFFGVRHDRKVVMCLDVVFVLQD